MFSSKKNRVHVEDKKAVLILKTLLNNLILKTNFDFNKKIIVLCIGTDRSTGDSLGPLTGTMLIENNHLPAKVLGNLDNPVHAKNLDQKIDHINEQYINPYIIAVDAGLGKKSSVGYIDIKKGPLKPGTGVNKQLTSVGNMHITGLVNVSGYMEYLVLQSTRLSLVVKMAKIISIALKRSLLTLKNKKKKRRKLID